MITTITPMHSGKSKQSLSFVLVPCRQFLLLFAFFVQPMIPAMAAPTTNEPEPASSQAVNTLPDLDSKKAALPVGEQLLQEFKKGYGVTFGSVTTAPLLYVAVTPSCKDCKEFWKMVRERVQKGALRVRLYPAGLKGDDDERASARWLQSANPMTVWNSYVDGNIAALAGIADVEALDHVRVNTALIDRWRFPAAPYIWYRAKDNQIKVVQGMPKNLQDVLTDVAPEQPETKP